MAATSAPHGDHGTAAAAAEAAAAAAARAAEETPKEHRHAASLDDSHQGHAPGGWSHPSQRVHGGAGGGNNHWGAALGSEGAAATFGEEQGRAEGAAATTATSDDEDRALHRERMSALARAFKQARADLSSACRQTPACFF